MSQGDSSEVFSTSRVSARQWQGSGAGLLADTGVFQRLRSRTPPVAPREAAADPGPDEVDPIVLKIMSLDLVATVVLQRIYVGTSITLMTHLLAFACLLYYRRVRVTGIRVALYWSFWGGAIAMQLLSGNSFSVSSIELGLVCYATFIGVVPASEQTYLAFLAVFQKVSMGIAILVLVDIASQLLGLGMPNMDAILPAGLSPAGMNYIQPITWGSSIMKPNGFFMLEASATSQMVVLGLIFEISLFKRWQWLAVFALALLLTFSGTGLLLLILCLPVLLRRFWRPVLLYGLILLPLLAGLAAVTGWYDIASKRATTFDMRNTSANARFVAPFTTMYDIAASGDEHTILFGYGAGKTAGEIYVPGLDTNEYNPVSKAFVEYGLVATLTFLLFIFYCAFSTNVLFIAAYAVFVQYHFMGGHMLLPPNINYLYLLTAGWAVRKSVPASAAPGGSVRIA